MLLVQAILLLLNRVLFRVLPIQVWRETQVTRYAWSCRTRPASSPNSGSFKRKGKVSGCRCCHFHTLVVVLPEISIGLVFLVFEISVTVFPDKYISVNCDHFYKLYCNGFVLKQCYDSGLKTCFNPNFKRSITNKVPIYLKYILVLNLLCPQRKDSRQGRSPTSRSAFSSRSS